MIVADYSPRQIRSALVNQGLRLQVGPLKINVRSNLSEIHQGVLSLYSDYAAEIVSEFSDFHIKVFKPKSIRRWFRAQVLFSNDDYIPFKPLPASQACAFLEWGLNWCVSQYIHRYLILHAAVVEKNGFAAIMPAAPGSGKSTLCATLISRGWRLLSDEMALIRLSDGLITPIPRPVSLKNESIALLKNFEPNNFISDPTYDTSKGTVAHMRAPANSVAEANTMAKPGWLIAPCYEKGSKSVLEPESKGHAMMMAIENSFNYNLLGGAGFDALTAFVDSCQCYNYRYSSLDDAVATFENLST